MKDYINLFYSILDKLHEWETLSLEEKSKILSIFLDHKEDVLNLAKYFEEYRKKLSNNTLNFYIKGVIKP